MTSPRQLNPQGAREQNCIHIAAQREFTYSILACLSEEQLDATLRLMLWMSETNATEAEVWAECARTYGGDRRFADTVTMAMTSIRSPRQVAANDEVLSLADRAAL